MRRAVPATPGPVISRKPRVKVLLIPPPSRPYPKTIMVTDRFWITGVVSGVCGDLLATGRTVPHATVTKQHTPDSSFHADTPHRLTANFYRDPDQSLAPRVPIPRSTLSPQPSFWAVLALYV